MAAPQNSNLQKTELALAFTAPELAQLEAFAALHGEAVAAFVQRAVLEVMGAAPPKASAGSGRNDMGALWPTDGFSGAPGAKDEQLPAPSVVAAAPLGVRKEPERLGIAPTAVAKRRGVVGEQSKLAKGHGLVWDIRRALGRVHGLGWTREQLAFVLKLSVVGVRKMEHQGTSPVKSLEARQKLLGLAKTLEHPSPEIAAYIEREESTLG